MTSDVRIICPGSIGQATAIAALLRIIGYAGPISIPTPQPHDPAALPDLDDEVDDEEMVA